MGLNGSLWDQMPSARRRKRRKRKRSSSSNNNNNNSVTTKADTKLDAAPAEKHAADQQQTLSHNKRHTAPTNITVTHNSRLAPESHSDHMQQHVETLPLHTIHMPEAARSKQHDTEKVKSVPREKHTNTAETLPHKETASKNPVTGDSTPEARSMLVNDSNLEANSSRQDDENEELSQSLLNTQNNNKNNVLSPLSNDDFDEEESVSLLSREDNNKKDLLAELQQELKSAQSALQASRDENASLRAKNLRLETSLSTLQKENKALQEQCGSWQEQSNRHKQQLQKWLERGVSIAETIPTVVQPAITHPEPPTTTTTAKIIPSPRLRRETPRKALQPLDNNVAASEKRNNSSKRPVEEEKENHDGDELKSPMRGTSDNTTLGPNRQRTSRESSSCESPKSHTDNKNTRSAKRPLVSKNTKAFETPRNGIPLDVSFPTPVTEHPMAPPPKKRPRIIVRKPPIDSDDSDNASATKVSSPQRNEVRKTPAASDDSNNSAVPRVSSAKRSKSVQAKLPKMFSNTKQSDKTPTKSNDKPQRETASSSLLPKTLRLANSFRDQILGGASEPASPASSTESFLPKAAVSKCNKESTPKRMGKDKPPLDVPNRQPAESPVIVETQTLSPQDDDEPDYRYQEVVRSREERRALPGHTCAECQAFVNALCNAPGGDVFDRSSLMECSRHRARHTPPSTPEGFWELSFVDEIEERNNRNGMNERD